MRLLALLIAGVLVAGAPDAAAQRRRTPPKKAATPPAPPKVEPAKVQCRESLGKGVKTLATYCFVLAGRDPAEGVIVNIPPHNGPATLVFTLHNRHTYSDEDTKTGRAFASYTAGIGVLTMTGELLGRGAVRSEFRGVNDLFERIGGGAGPSGFKAVAPIGNETIYVTIPPAVTQVSLLGEVLDAVTHIGRETATPGRPVAIVSNVSIEYRPLK